MTGQTRPRLRNKRLVVLKGAPARDGVVWLVGAGPGDPDLLTVKALRLLQRADVVVHDRLAPQAILDLASASARMIDVGKRKSHHTLPQDDINQLLVALAREGLTVVRLKGGDPFMFGRGGEELAVLREAGVEAHVVPGVTAALATGVPLTHRGLAQAVTFVTGHAASGAEPDLDWASLAKANQTVVVYMGLSTAPRIAARLMAAGRAGSTPVLVVENASLENERRVVTTLSALGADAADLDGPALLVIGEVAALEKFLSPCREKVSAQPTDEVAPAVGIGSGTTRGQAGATRKTVSLREPPSPARGEGLARQVHSRVGGHPKA